MIGCHARYRECETGRRLDAGDRPGAGRTAPMPNYTKNPRGADRAASSQRNIVVLLPRIGHRLAMQRLQRAHQTTAG